MISASQFAKRFLSSKIETKCDFSLVARLRRETAISIGKARQALIATSNDYNAALEWLDAEAKSRGAKLNEKYSDRATNQGWIFMTKSQSRVSLVKLGCETDFVARTEQFRNLGTRIAATVLWHNEKELMELPLAPHPHAQTLDTEMSVQEGIQKTMATLGEKIQVIDSTTREGTLGSYQHGGIDAFTASIAAVVHVSDDYKAAGELAQHVVGCSPLNVPEMLQQKFLLDDSLTVESFVLKKQLKIMDFVRWEFT